MIQPRLNVLPFVPLILWLSLIFYFSHQPATWLPNYGQWDLLIKKCGHFIAYGILALLARAAGFNYKSALVLVLAYAASDELHQLYVPGRFAALSDMVIDLLGGLSALLLHRLVAAGWRRSRWGRRAATDGQMPGDV